MKPANTYMFFKDVKACILVNINLTDPILKQFSFESNGKQVTISAAIVDSNINLVYACFVNGNQVCNDCGVIPRNEIYSVITAIVNDFLG